MNYTSTRDNKVSLSASKAILQGLSHDGGLFVPEVMPKLGVSLDALTEMNYREVAYEVMKQFFTDFTEEELKYCIDSAYDKKFDTDEIAPLVELKDEYILELFHGKTIAFKDMALSILPYLMQVSAKKNNVNNEIVILTATSGDTGKAALAGFADVPGTSIIVFYPKDGVSPIQKQQMLTQEGDNTNVVGIEGNFDDAQTGVKKIFNDKELAEKMNKNGYQFSSANSINIGRLVPQVVYYFYSYKTLLKNGKIKSGDKVNFVVPTGNFGNILAAYYAKEMGLPVNKLICASNENKVLYDFFKNGTYDKNREFILTSSPSMDILVSSNLERLIYFMTGRDAEKTKEYMDSLSSKGVYSVSAESFANAGEFYGGFATEDEDKATIKAVFEKEHYVLDTHTAVAVTVYNKYVADTGDKTPTIVDSTASPYKFTKSVMEAIDPKYADKGDFELVSELEKISGVPVPKAVSEIITAPVRHNRICAADKMKEEVCDILGI
ncbi:threonine synthase [Howardella ureilytica]|nr:threonine synthase [Lachnospiraceae bacterium]MDY2956031.1 threonine synthase [Lachnospiraceae bacterium]